MSGLNTLTSWTSSYSYNGISYNLKCTSRNCPVCGSGSYNLEEFLLASGWKKEASTSASNIHAASVIFCENYGHVVIGVGENSMDAHNTARYHVSQPWYNINAIYNKV